MNVYEMIEWGRTVRRRHQGYSSNGSYRPYTAQLVEDDAAERLRQLYIDTDNGRLGVALYMADRAQRTANGLFSVDSEGQARAIARDANTIVKTIADMLDDSNHAAIVRMVGQVCALDLVEIT